MRIGNCAAIHISRHTSLPPILMLDLHIRHLRAALVSKRNEQVRKKKERVSKNKGYRKLP